MNFNLPNCSLWYKICHFDKQLRCSRSKTWPDQMLLARLPPWYQAGMGYWLWSQLTLLCALCHLSINIYAPHKLILLLYVFQFSSIIPQQFIVLLLWSCTLFIISLSTSFFDFGYFDSTDHLFKFCVIFYLNKNIKHVNEVSITL